MPNDSFLDRALVEHQYLPNAFYDNPQQILASLAVNGAEALYKIYYSAFPGKYQHNQFHAKAFPKRQTQVHHWKEK